MIIVSDLHFHLSFPQLRERLTSIISYDEDRVVLLAGDVTHEASFEQYLLFMQWVQHLRGLGIKLVACPGNHDLTFGVAGIRFKRKLGADLWREVIGATDQGHMLASNGLDAVYEIRTGSEEVDIFAAMQTAHMGLGGTATVRKSQIKWLQEVLPINEVARYHLLTHHSLWRCHHAHMSGRARLITDILIPFGFETSINGHNHIFKEGQRQKKGWDAYHIQTPALASRKARNYSPSGVVQWRPGTRAKVLPVDGW